MRYLRSTICAAVLLAATAAPALSQTAHDLYKQGKTAYQANDYKLAQTLLQEAATQGDAQAQFLLGYMNYKGEGGQDNPQAALGWFVKAAEQGHGKARYFAGLMYLKGEGTSHDPAKGVSYLSSAAKSLEPDAAILLGTLYLGLEPENYGVARDPHNGLAILSETAERYQNGRAALVLAKYYQDAGDADPQQGLMLYWLAQAARYGDAQAKGLVANIGPSAMRQIGMVYFSGDAGAVNEAEGVRWLEMAADGGDAKAQLELGGRYLSPCGKSIDAIARNAAEKATGGLTCDRNQGRSYLEKAALQNNPEAMTKLGLDLSADGDPADMAKAIDWIKRAAQANFPEAEYALYVLYQKGGDEERDESQSHLWLQKAADGQFTDAQRDLGIIYFRGDDIYKRDLAKAHDLLFQAAEAHNATSAFLLYIMSVEGIGVPANSSEAQKWYKIATDNFGDEAELQYFLGKIYMNGLSLLPKKTIKGMDWLQKSANANNVDAATALGILYYNNKDYTAAAQWLNKAYANKKAGSSDDYWQGLYTLGMMYTRGQGVSQSLHNAEGPMIRLAYGNAPQTYAELARAWAREYNDDRLGDAVDTSYFGEIDK
jgi:TPR repeat protein